MEKSGFLRQLQGTRGACSRKSVEEGGRLNPLLTPPILPGTKQRATHPSGRSPHLVSRMAAAGCQEVTTLLATLFQKLATLFQTCPVPLLPPWQSCCWA